MKYFILALVNDILVSTENEVNNVLSVDKISQSSSFFQHWLQFSSILQLLDIITTSNKFAANEDPWNLQK